jgi:hypothetical protein
MLFNWRQEQPLHLEPDNDGPKSEAQQLISSEKTRTDHHGRSPTATAAESAAHIGGSVR